MDIAKKCEFEKLNANKVWEDKCNACCIINCKLFGDFEKECHCGNFKDSDCKKCKHKTLTF